MGYYVTVCSKCGKTQGLAIRLETKNRFRHLLPCLGNAPVIEMENINPNGNVEGNF